MQICNKIVIKNPTRPEMQCYTALWNIDAIFRIQIFAR